MPKVAGNMYAPWQAMAPHVAGGWRVTWRADGGSCGGRMAGRVRGGWRVTWRADGRSREGRMAGRVAVRWRDTRGGGRGCRCVDISCFRKSGGQRSPGSAMARLQHFAQKRIRTLCRKGENTLATFFGDNL